MSFWKFVQRLIIELVIVSIPIAYATNPQIDKHKQAVSYEIERLTNKKGTWIIARGGIELTGVISVKDYGLASRTYFAGVPVGWGYMNRVSINNYAPLLNFVQNN